MKLIELHSFVNFIHVYVIMGPPKTTGNSHKKKLTTYESKRSKPSEQLDWQRTLDMFRKENVSTSSTVNNDEEQQVIDNETEMKIDTPVENMADV